MLVETTGRPPARYSGVLVGEMNRVAVVVREWHQRHVPARQVLRQHVVRFLAEVVNVGRLRRALRIDLDDRTDQHQVPVWPQARNLLDKLQIHALVDDAEEAEPRMRNAGLIGRLLPAAARACPK